MSPLSRSTHDRIECFKESLRKDTCALIDLIPTDAVKKWKDSHVSTIKLRRQYELPGQAVDDPSFVCALENTLQAWGFDGSDGRPRLVEHEEFVRQIKQAANVLDTLSNLRIESTCYNVDMITNELWDVISELEITHTKPRLVSASKAIHHLLPDLVPPIDGWYSGNFFGKKRSRSQNDFSKDKEERTFRDIFPAFAQLARCLAPQLQSLVSPDSFNTSIPKTLDNAIIGFKEANK